MVCHHLRPLEAALEEKGFKETYRGQAWSKECREWVYFDCYLDSERIRQRFRFDPCVIDHQHLGTHDGQEAGFYCTVHKDGIMGLHPGSAAASHTPAYRGE
jgi:hypothetical protein